MKDLQHNAALWMAVTLAAALTACGGGGGGNSTTPPPPAPTYTLTVNTVDPTTGVAMTVSPADNNGAGNGNASFTRTYKSGTAVTITAPATAGSHTFQRMVRMHHRKHRDLQRNGQCEHHHHRDLHFAQNHRHTQFRDHRLAGAVQRGSPHRRDRQRDLDRRCALRQFA